MPETGESGYAFVLLAAGRASRMGRPKQLLDFHGQPLIRHAASMALASGCWPVVVVLGAYEPDVRPALAELPLEIVVNHQWAAGVGSSIHTGLRTLEGREGVAGVVLGLADQPLVAAGFLRDMPATLRRSGRQIVASAYAGTVGVPACFAREMLPLLMALPRDSGCKSVILSHLDDTVMVDCPEAAADIDSPEDYRRYT